MMVRKWILRYCK